MKLAMTRNDTREAASEDAMSDKALKIAYWIATSLYFMKLLGVAKLLGVVTIAIGRFDTLKEWAYAGITFDLVAASVSHLASGDPAWKAAVPLAFLAVLMVSYGAWKRLHGAVALPPERTARRLRTYAPSRA
jgi:hypothetical protein